MADNSSQWAIYRDRRQILHATTFREAQDIIRHARKLNPTSEFKAVYLGKNRGYRDQDELIG